MQRQLTANQDTLAGERQTSTQARKQAEELLARLDSSAAELARVQAELERQRASREQAEADGLQQWSDAKSRHQELELARADALSRCIRLEEKLTGLRQENVELKGRLAAEELTAVESGQTQERLEEQLRRVAADLESLEAAKAEVDRHAVEAQAQHCRTLAALEAQLRSETQVAAQARQQTEDLQQRLDETRAALERAQADSSRLSAERARSESQQRAELERATAGNRMWPANVPSLSGANNWKPPELRSKI